MAGVEQSTILWGMMGSGKSTLGQGLAEHLGQPFVDTDQLIEKAFGVSCAELIASPRKDFGVHQTAAITAHIPTTPEVIATGGSVAMYPELVRHLGQFGLGIFIDVPVGALESRLTSERIAAINNPDNLTFGELCRVRAEFYNAAADRRLWVPGYENEGTTLERLIGLRATES
ncbi:MAG TPA: shikimate kinase [Patescibacteria group bacterium]|nr:shikimate kinase [Patescibacteria group bacterium]